MQPTDEEMEERDILERQYQQLYDQGNPSIAFWKEQNRLDRQERHLTTELTNAQRNHASRETVERIQRQLQQTREAKFTLKRVELNSMMPKG
jgi:hypothetical protein